MLVLTRRENESIRIGDEITITVLKTRSGNVRLGIECPREIPVMRSELVDGEQADGRPPAAA